MLRHNCSSKLELAWWRHSRGGSGSAASPAAPSRGRTGSATPASGSKSRPPTPSVSSTSSVSKGVAAAAQADDRAKAEAVLGKLLEEDPSPRVRGMVEGLLLRCLAGRRLLPGNLVALPLFGQHALFVVEHVALASGGAPPSKPASEAAPEQQPTPAPALEQPGREPVSQAAAAAVPPPVTADTSVRLLAQGEAPPAPGLQPQARDWVAAATAAAAEALGCGPEDAGPVAAARAVSAGLASRGITYDQLGGADKQAAALRELVVLPLRAPQIFASYNITPPRGVLLYGPPGTGKTVLACATAAAVGARFFVINGPEVVSEYFGESEAGLRGIFAAAAALQPSVVFIDELDALAPARGGGPGGGKASSGGGSSARMVATLLTEMDALGAARVVVVAATNRPDSLDEALRRPGRFDREVEVGVPPPGARRDILTKQLAGMAHSLTPDQVTALADAAHGFVAADLAALCSEAAMIALRRLVAQRAGSIGGSDGGGSGGSAGQACVTLADFQAAETRVRPSAMRELALEVPKVSWDDIGGLEDVKQRLKEAVELPFQEPEALARLGVVPPRGILLHGPPGCSKTLLARAVASQARLNFISVKGPELYSKYVGESEKALAALFAKARASSPAVIFFDEIDGLAKMREASGEGGVGVGERMLAQLLQDMDGLQSRVGVVVIGATNRPDCLDPALLRPGRFDRLVEDGQKGSQAQQ
ncbi:Spermatogenesis-associated [Chlorella sorokiniana]|uniref:Spermatogenesis-associated n=1 Tax=Chlorella sorokiniana TaxID=3076 RepID=A0A2P6TC94_CHLSO|nr:Spermatogenesis-associated [Chlorella sorokiniana]|eukprot:PRW20261.1 Spermatogenesis-associated [Chlorella sorokiniana]